MDVQRLRNLTTGRLHTEIGHVYEDLELITGERGLMTHMLPRVMAAVEPWLKDHIPEQRFWDGKYDTAHTGEYTLPGPTKEDRTAMFERYKQMPNPLEGKDVITVHV
ncbi:MAG: hypothetical protein ABW134_11575 [Candidatus Thiodiazotropha endolucinida]